MKTKKLKLIVAIVLFIGLLAIMQNYVGAAYTPEGDWTYEVVNDETVTIKSYNGSSTNVTIPNTINGYPVTKIDGEAFGNHTEIKTLYIPTNIKEINTGYYGAFYGCNFTKVTFANDCKITDFGGFRGMTKLTSINIPKNVKTILDGALYECTSLTTITIPSGVTKIEGEAFGNCTGITTITIPSSVQEINTGYYGAFYGCNFTKVTFANDCKITEFGGFRGMTKLTSINIPKNVKTILDGALYGCTSLKTIKIPSNVTKIEGEAFGNCTSLEEIDIPTSVTEINNSYYHAFYGCDTSKLVVYCASKSNAIGFAKEHGIKYKRIDNVEDYTISGISNKTYTGNNITFNIAVKQRSTTLKQGTDYRIAYTGNKNTGKGTVIITGQGNYSGKVIKTFYIYPTKVTGVKVYAQSTSAIKLKWNTNPGNVSGYKVYVYDSSIDEYKYVGKTSDTKIKISGLKSGTTYKFRVRAYKTVDGKQYFGGYSSSIKTTTVPAKTKITSISSKSQKASLNWKKSSGTTKYQVYMSTSKNGKYTKIKTTTATKYTKSSLKKGKTYYFKVRSYRTVDGKTVYSSWSKVQAVKVK